MRERGIEYAGQINPNNMKYNINNRIKRTNSLRLIKNRPNEKE